MDLLAAARLGDTDAIRALLESGAEINNGDRWGVTPLLAAATEGHADVTRLLLESGADLTACDVSGWTALICAAHHAHVEIVRMLLEAGASADIESVDGLSPIRLAAVQGDPDIIRLLVNAQAVLSEHDAIRYLHGLLEAQGRTVQLAQTAVLESGVVREAEVYVVDGPMRLDSDALKAIDQYLHAMLSSENGEGYSDLRFRIGVQFVSQVARIGSATDTGKRLVALGTLENSRAYSPRLHDVIHFHASANKEDKDGFTLLHCAARAGHATVARAIAAAGADIEAPFNVFGEAMGWTPLHFAASYGHQTVVRTLLAAGADIEARGDHASTPLIIAAGDPAMAILLIESGADPNVLDAQRRVPLAVASYHGHIQTVRSLLVNGARVDLPGPHRMTAAMLAASHGQVETLDLLITSGADLSARDDEGRTPLMWAAFEGQAAAVSRLIQYGAPISDVDNDQWSALLWSAMHGNAMTVSALIAAGADIDHGGKNGETALIQAAKGGNVEVVRVLLEAGADPELKDQDELTALDFAMALEHSGVESLFREN